MTGLKILFGFLLLANLDTFCCDSDTRDCCNLDEKYNSSTQQCEKDYSYDDDDDYSGSSGSSEKEVLGDPLLIKVSWSPTLITVELAENNTQPVNVISSNIVIKKEGLTGPSVGFHVTEITPLKYELSGFNLSGTHFLIFKPGAFRSTVLTSHAALFKIY